MVDRASGFVLPLMNHLVEERMQHLVPSMPAKMAPTDRDFAWSSLLRGRVVSKTALHSPRYTHRHGLELAAEVFVVEPSMPRRETLGSWFVLGTSALAAHRATRRVDDVGDDASLCGAPFGACSTFDERDDRLVDFDRRVEVSLMHAKFVRAEADHDVAVARQLATRDPLEPQRAQEREQLVRVARLGRIEFQRELPRIGPAGEERFQRAKHFTGPATKSRCSADHSIVDTSMSASVILMLFTDDGRPPRDRLLIVPDVEMIVPRFVCSM